MSENEERSGSPNVEIIDTPMDDLEELIGEDVLLPGFNEHNRNEAVEVGNGGNPVPMDTSTAADSIDVHAGEIEDDLLGPSGPLVMDVPSSSASDRPENNDSHMSLDEEELLNEPKKPTARETASSSKKKSPPKPPTANPLPKETSTEDSDHDKPGPSGLQSRSCGFVSKERPCWVTNKDGKKVRPRKQLATRRPARPDGRPYTDTDSDDSDCSDNRENRKIEAGNRKRASDEESSGRKKQKGGNSRPVERPDSNNATVADNTVEPANSAPAVASNASPPSTQPSQQSGEGWVINRPEHVGWNSSSRQPESSGWRETTNRQRSSGNRRENAGNRQNQRSQGQAGERYDPDLAWHQRRLKAHYWLHRFGEGERSESCTNPANRLAKDLDQMGAYAKRKGFGRYFPTKQMIKIGESIYFGVSPINPPARLREDIKSAFMKLVNLREEDMGYPSRSPKFDVFVNELDEVQKAYSKRMAELTAASNAPPSSQHQQQQQQQQQRQQQPQRARPRYMHARRPSTDSLPTYSMAMRDQRAGNRRFQEPLPHRPESPLRPQQSAAPMIVSPIQQAPTRVVTGVSGTTAGRPTIDLTQPVGENEPRRWGEPRVPKEAEIVPDENLNEDIPYDYEPELTEEERARKGYFWNISPCHFNVSARGLRRPSPNFIADSVIIRDKITDLMKRRATFERDLVTLGVTKISHPAKLELDLDAFLVRSGDPDRFKLACKQLVLVEDARLDIATEILDEFVQLASPSKFPLGELMCFCANEAFLMGGPAVRRLAHRANERILAWAFVSAKKIKAHPPLLITFTKSCLLLYISAKTIVAFNLAVHITFASTEPASRRHALASLFTFSHRSHNALTAVRPVLAKKF
ncbi:Oidioi.mRNA.OKI2018_I69.chr1.g2255.t1.cds [Oikopleura dioica]|uniref:Oidioi.mRNA.OKI2018_I69.chr1.g2255.t1.cds n=1 Tax=Oikopleura dioica TaxID=34765 RepID=A0ABN7SU36_OIKDI|nr:Oidioi.mRNA.OKI2018_I69.chr1.g2255.t1.cds [Oikopleura dioica]